MIIGNALQVKEYGKYERKFKEIDPHRVLNLNKTGIEPLAPDEIFVSVRDTIDTYISNYGRLLTVSDGAYSLVNGQYDDGHLLYSDVPVCMLKDGKWSIERVSGYADRIVVDTFLINDDIVYNTAVWHKGNNTMDNYYKNLYPMTLDQHCMLLLHYDETGDDSENTIHWFINDRFFKPGCWDEYLYMPTVRNVAYHGTLEFSSESLHREKAYKTWLNMWHRIGKTARYKDVTICDEWRSYSNFRDWYHTHFYQIPGEEMAIDKDILCKGNTVYAPEHCVFVPQCINNLLVLDTAGKNKKRPLPKGVYKSGTKYRAMVSIDDKEITIGRYATQEEAFASYKNAKETEIKRLANKYREWLPQNLYNALYRWEIEPFS